MSATCIIDVFWGDSGKGKIVDYLTAYDGIKHICRFNGSANAGHTLYRDGQKYVSNMVPCGFLTPDVNLYIAAGCVVDIRALEAEVEGLQERLGRRLNIFLSTRAHVVTALDQEMDAVRDKAAGIGTTKKGVGPAYAAKAYRNGIRVGELLTLTAHDIFTRLQQHDGANYVSSAEQLEISNGLFYSFGRLTEELGVNVCDVEETIRSLLRSGEEVLFEGAQGTFLDVSHGDYPFCTSSHTVASAASTYCGFPPQEIKRVVAVTKPYITRVGNGPLDYELDGAEGEAIRKVGNEYGAVTGRPRRVAWLDLDKLKLSCQINGATEIALTKADLLQCIPEIKVAKNGQVLSPENTSIDNFVEMLEKELEIPVRLIGVGPSTENIIERKT